MRLTDSEAAARIDDTPGHDVRVLRIEDRNLGCCLLDPSDAADDRRCVSLGRT